MNRSVSSNRRLASAWRPLLGLALLAGAGFLAWGLAKQSAIGIAARHGDRPNPWRGLPGCMATTASAGAAPSFLPLGAGARLVCEAQGLAPTPGLALRHGDAVLAALSDLSRGPLTALPGTPSTPTLHIDGREIAKGPDLSLTLVAPAQVQAQQIADCMTGRIGHPGCAAQPSIQAAGPRPDMLEAAAARVLALVDVDLATGGIRAIASGSSPCAERQRQRRLPPFADCPPATDADASPADLPVVDHHALFTDAMPGSIVKPWLMLGLLAAPGARPLTAADRAWVLRTLQTSDSPALFDRLLCASAGFPASCAGTSALARTAQALGMNSGSKDLLPTDGAARLVVVMPRVLQRPVNGGWAPQDTRMPPAEQLKRCRSQDYEQCAGEQTANLLSELWGQGNALMTPLGAAQMLAYLGAAANGAPVAPVHLVSQVGGVAAAPAATRVPVNLAHARLVAEGMALTHRSGGTAHAACAAVIGPAACNRIGAVAGKTGTPAFPHESLTLAERSALCSNLATAHAAGGTRTPRERLEWARCHLRPAKWYIALVRDSDAPGAPFARAVVVLAERNWRQDGRLDSVGDRGVNVAAAAAWHYIARTRQPAPAAAAAAARPGLPA